MIRSTALMLLIAPAPGPAHVQQEAIPELKAVVYDEFGTDSRLRYQVSGDVGWKTGRLSLPDGASIIRPFEGSARARFELELELLGLTPERSKSELRIWFLLDGVSNCFVRLRRERVDGETVTSVGLVDTSEQGGQQVPYLIRELSVPAFADGALVIDYRHGLVRVSLAERSILTGYISNGDAAVRGIAVHTLGAGTDLRLLTARTAANARELTRQQRETLETADAAHDQMLGLFEESKFVDAASLGEESLRLRRSLPGPLTNDAAICLNDLAFLYFRMGDFARAEPLYQESLQIRKVSLGEQHPDYATSLNNVALLYASTGDFARAEPLYKQALRICKSALGDRDPEYATCLNNLALLYENMGEYARAEPLYRQTIEIEKSVLGEQDPGYATSLNNLALLYQNMGEHAQAESLYKQAIAIEKAVLGEQHPSYATSLNNLAVLYESMGDHARAESLYRQTIAIEKAVLGDRHPDYAASLHNLGTLYENLGDDRRAEPLYRHAVEIIRGNLNETSVVQSERQQKRNQSRQRSYLDSQIGSALQTGASPGPVLTSVWQWKGAVTLRQQAYRQVASNAKLAPLFASLQAVSRQLSALAGEVPAPPPVAASDAVRDSSDRERQRWDAQFARLSREREDLEQQIAAGSAEFRTLREPLTVAAVQRLLPPKTAFVDFLEYDQTVREPPPNAVTQRSYVAFVVRPDRDPQMLQLGNADSLGEAIIAFRRPFVAESGDIGASTEAAARLRRDLWVPLEQRLQGIETVIISPDTALGRLPFGVLPGERPGSFLIEQYRFASLPLAAMLRSLLDDAAPRRQPEKGLLVVGDVDYDANGAVASSPEGRESRPAWMRRSAPRGDKVRWQSLDGFQQELAIVRDRFESKFGGGVTTLRKGEATEARFIEQASRHYNLHLITHGFFADPAFVPLEADGDDKSRGPTPRTMLGGNAAINQYMPGLLSGLVLAGANNPPRSDENGADGILTAAEIETLDLNAVDLVVLSACETGLGKTAGGEGLTGLQRAFHVAGARSCIASLWQVPDRATQELMSRFYRYYWDEGLSKIDSLRNAQLDILNDPELTRGLGGVVGSDPPREQSRNAQRSDPRYWAAFVLSGDWR